MGRLMKMHTWVSIREHVEFLVVDTRCVPYCGKCVEYVDGTFELNY